MQRSDILFGLTAVVAAIASAGITIAIVYALQKPAPAAASMPEEEKEEPIETATDPITGEVQNVHTKESFRERFRNKRQDKENRRIGKNIDKYLKAS